MRGKPVDKESLYQVFEKNADATLAELAKLTNLSAATMSVHRREWQASKKPKPQLTVPQRYKESDVRFAVVSGCVLGIILTITAAAFIGVI
jgi:hypothetical protein